MKSTAVTAGLALLVSSVSAIALTPIAPHQALSNRGQCVTVAGIASVRHDPQRLGTDVDLDGKNSSFLGFIPAGDESRFPDLGAYDGKPVEITGVVHFYLGRAEVTMTSAPQLKAASSDDQENGLTHVGPQFQRTENLSAVCG